MQSEVIAELLYYFGFMQAVDVYPGDGRFVFKRKTLLDCRGFSLGNLPFIVIENSYSDLFGFSFPDMNQCPRGKSRLFRPFSNQPAHRFSSAGSFSGRVVILGQYVSKYNQKQFLSRIYYRWGGRMGKKIFW